MLQRSGPALVPEPLEKHAILRLAADADRPCLTGLVGRPGSSAAFDRALGLPLHTLACGCPDRGDKGPVPNPSPTYLLQPFPYSNPILGAR